MAVGRREASRLRPAWTLGLTSGGFFMVALDALVVVTALPAIHADLGGSLSTLEWAVNAYLLAFAAGIITAAALGDRLGRRAVYVAGLALFVVERRGSRRPWAGRSADLAFVRWEVVLARRWCRCACSAPARSSRRTRLRS